MKSIYYNYQFDFPDGHKKTFYVDFDKKSLKSELSEDKEYPDWTQLEFNQCKNCPLTSEDYLYCPLAINLVPIISWCKDLASYDEVDVTVTSAEREVHAHTSLQRAISSLLGLLMSSSACPNMKFLRPLARFHLPLATHEETIYRTVSSAFLQHYFSSEKRSSNDALLKLKEQYKELQNINLFVAKRIKTAIRKDAAVNALVILDVLSKSVSYSIDDSLQKIRYVFENNDEAGMVYRMI